MQPSGVWIASAFFVTILAIVASLWYGQPTKNNDHAATSTTLTKIWTIAPDSTGLLVDAAIFQHFLGSQNSIVQYPPPQHDNDDEKNCVYLFLEVTPTIPNSDFHVGWKDEARNCSAMLMANTDQFTKDHIIQATTKANNRYWNNLELILCKTRQCVAFVQQLQQETRKDKSKIPILYIGFTSFAPPLSSPPQEHNTNDLARYDRFLHVAGQRYVLYAHNTQQCT